MSVDDHHSRSLIGRFRVRNPGATPVPLLTSANLGADGSGRGFVAAKMAIEPRVSSFTRSNDASRISRRPSWVSPRLSKVPRRLLTLRTLRANRVCRPESPRIDAPKRTPVGARTSATLATAAALRESGPGRQWSTPLSAAESNGPWTGSGFVGGGPEGGVVGGGD